MEEKFVIVVNAVNIKAAGGLTVTLNFLNIVRNSMPDVFLEVFCPANCGFESYQSENVNLNFIPKFMEFPLLRVWGDHLWLKRRIDSIEPDVVFTMGNIAVPTHYKQGVIFMWPYVIYPKEKHVWGILSKRSFIKRKLIIKIFERRLKYANVIFPQTKTSAERLKEYYPDIKRLHIVPMAYSKITNEDNLVDKAFFKKLKSYKYLLCLTRYYAHKNVEIFIDLAKMINENEAPFKIITTIDPSVGPEARAFIDKVNNLKLSETIINLGTIPVNNVRSLYSQVDGLLLPTLLESFSATYVDSLFLKKPIFTSDRDFSKEVCGDSAYYFNPLSASSIYKIITAAFNDPLVMENKIQEGKRRVDEFPDWDQVASMYVEQLKNM